jgi:predicted Zn-ribbon and HTH transcriptional regulator
LTIGLLRGANKSGHRGWVTEKCIICATTLDLFHAYDLKNVYYCPKCLSQGIKAYFCAADARKVHYKCPFCKSELKPYY